MHLKGMKLIVMNNSPIHMANNKIIGKPLNWFLSL